MSDNDKPTPNENGEAAEQPVKKINGGRNLIILGLAAIAVAVTTSGISLWIYRQNDIYLDRSRPGFISDGEENEDIKIDKFSEEGEISKEVLDKYLEESGNSLDFKDLCNYLIEIFTLQVYSNCFLFY